MKLPMTNQERLQKQLEVAQYKTQIHADAMLAFQGIKLGSCNCKNEAGEACTGPVANNIDVFCPDHWKLIEKALRQELLNSRNVFLKDRKNGWTRYAMHIVGAKLWLQKKVRSEPEVTENAESSEKKE